MKIFWIFLRKPRKGKRELEEAKKNIEIEIGRKLDEERMGIYEKAKDEFEKDHELKEKENEKKIKELTKQINELKKKAEQGSQKMQGTVLEEELQERLNENFTDDEIQVISAGYRVRIYFRKYVREMEKCWVLF